MDKEGAIFISIVTIVLIGLIVVLHPSNNKLNKSIVTNDTTTITSNSSVKNSSKTIKTGIPTIGDSPVCYGECEVGLMGSSIIKVVSSSSSSFDFDGDGKNDPYTKVNIGILGVDGFNMYGKIVISVHNINGTRWKIKRVMIGNKTISNCISCVFWGNDFKEHFNYTKDRKLVISLILVPMSKPITRSTINVGFVMYMERPSNEIQRKCSCNVTITP